MRAVSGFAYTQARIQSRFACLADESVWQHLEAARSLSGFLEEARHTPLEHWVCGFSLVSDHHHIEQGLQRQFNGLLLEARQWSPEPWRQAVAWAAWLPELPLLQHMADSGAASPSPPQTPPPPQLSSGGPTPIAKRWLSRWRELWPSPHDRQVQGMEQLVDLVGTHMAGFPRLPADGGWEARKQLARGLRRLFRRHALQPAALFAGLALSALELERLRGALVTRAAFPAGDL